jgi:hypothetical protein
VGRSSATLKHFEGWQATLQIPKIGSMIEYGNLEAKQEWFSVPMRNRVRVVAKRNRIGLVALLLSLTTSIQLLAQQPRVDTIVKNAGAPLRAGLGQLVYDGVTIGHLEGAPEYTFTRVAGIELGRDASIYVFDVPMFQGTRFDGIPPRIPTAWNRGLHQRGPDLWL